MPGAAHKEKTSFNWDTDYDEQYMWSDDEDEDVIYQKSLGATAVEALGVPPTIELDHVWQEKPELTIDEILDDFGKQHGISSESSDIFHRQDAERAQVRELEMLLDTIPEAARENLSIQEFIRSISYNPEQTELAIGLLKSGYSPESIIKSTNVVFDGMKRINEKAHDPEASRGLLLQLLRCDGIKLDQPHSDLVDIIIEDPAKHAAMIAKIDAVWRGSSESGVPNDVKSETLLGSFNSYARSNGYSEIETYDDYHQKKIDALKVAFEIADKEVVDACALMATDGEQMVVRNFVDGLAREVMDGKRGLSAEEVKEVAREFIAVFTDAPEEIKTALVSAGSYFQIENPSDFIIFRRSIEAASEHVDALREIFEEEVDGVERAIIEALHGSIESQRRANEREGEYLISEDPAYSLRCAVDLYVKEPRFSKDIYRSIAQMGGLGAQQALERLQDPNLSSLLDDEAMRPELDPALRFLAYKDVDIGAAIDAFREIDCHLPGILEIIVATQPRVDDLKGPYYEGIRKFMSRKDKNGTPFDSPNAIRSFIEMQERLSSPEAEAKMSWFMSGSVPVALFDTVLEARNLIGKDADSLSPDEVYKQYCESRELIERISHQTLREYVGGNLKLNNRRAAKQLYEQSAVEDAIRLAQSDAERRKDSFRLFLNLSPEALIQAAFKGGEIKSILDTDVETEAAQTRGARYILHRSEIEMMAGVRSFGEEQHPIYASVGYVDRGVPAGAEGYGEIMITLNPFENDLAARTTFTPEDSFHGTERLTLEDAQALRVLKNGAGLDHTRTSDYIEAQIRGGVKIDAIESVYVKDTVTYERLKKYLPPELAAKVNLRVFGYDATKETELLGSYANGRNKTMRPGDEEMFADAPAVDDRELVAV